MASDEEAIHELLKQYAQLVGSGDFESWLALWTTDGCQMPPGAATRVGVDAIREGMQPAFDAMDLDLELLDVEEVSVFGDLGLTRCNYTLMATPKNGGATVELEADGKALTLYQRQPDGSWRIAYDCFNSNMA